MEAGIKSKVLWKKNQVGIKGCLPKESALLADKSLCVYCACSLLFTRLHFEENAASIKQLFYTITPTCRVQKRTKWVGIQSFLEHDGEHISFVSGLNKPLLRQQKFFI